MARMRALRDLQAEERVLLVARRHPLLLMIAALPTLLLALALVVLAAALQGLGSPLFRPVVAALLLGVPPWLAWVWADWRADALVLTDRRVLWVERTPFLRERRWESPLSGMQNAAAVTGGPIARLAGCADLVLDTASRGVQRLRGMRRANAAATAIVEAQGYSARRSSRLRRLRVEMGMDLALPASEPVPPVVAWRRHRWFLLRAGLGPAMLLFGGMCLSAASGHTTGMLLIGVIAFLWAGWIFEDWRNDETVATADSLTQTRRTPFGLREETWQASLDKVQDISYTMPSPLAHLLDYGTVSVVTAGDGKNIHLAGVPHPREVSADLNRRLYLRRKRRDHDLLREVESTVRAVLREEGVGTGNLTTENTGRTERSEGAM